MITIELDCPPGNPRPDDLLPSVLENTGLIPDDFQVISKLFGNWEFTLKDENKNQMYAEQRDTIGGRIKDLYQKRIIRYGSW